MTQVIGVGIIGMGWMGTVHSRAYLQAAERFHDSGIRPQSLWSARMTSKRAPRGASPLRLRAQHSHWQDVLADPDVQIVNVATPNYMHLPIVKDAAAAGKQIFCEKP